MPISHTQTLSDVNDIIFPKFQCREQLKANLSRETDPLIKDEIEDKMLHLRNDIISNVIDKLRDMLSARASHWRKSLWDDIYQSSRTPKWFTKLDLDGIKSLIYENLLEAVERYNPNKQPFCKFTSFFWTHNENMLKNKHKKLHIEKSDISKSISLDVIDQDRGKNKDGDESILSPYQDSCRMRGHRKLHPNLCTSDAVMENQLHHNMLLKKMLKKVASRKERHIIKRLYLGYSQSEIANIMGYSGTNINMTIKNIAHRCEELIYDVREV